MPKLKIALLMIVAASLNGCGKTVREQSPADAFPSSDPPPLSQPACDAAHLLEWKFTQPQPVINRSLDILFVTDTSPSLSNERPRIAEDIPAFVAQLSADTDYQVAVMLGHGGASRYSGRLYSPAGAEPVLSSRRSSLATIQTRLRATLSQIPADRDSANGEALLYSFIRGTALGRLAEIRQQGFFRENAALSVIFVTDENDLCFRPDLNGYREFPDFVASSYEVQGYANYCVDSNGDPVITPERALAALNALKPDRRFAAGGIIHLDPAKVPRGGEDSIGHGILELVRLDQREPDDMLVDISERDYSEGFAKLGSFSSSHLDLKTEFRLDAGKAIQPNSIRVRVDRKPIASTYESSARLARISLRDAGRAGSEVLIQACASD